MKKYIILFFGIITILGLCAAIPSTVVDDANTNKQVRAVAIIDEAGNQVGTSTSGLSVNVLPATDLEGIGDVTIGTSSTEISISGKSREVRIRADVDNTGIIFIGKTGVLSNKSNDYVRLRAGDEVIIQYDDATNALFAISDTAAQAINVGALF